MSTTDEPNLMDAWNRHWTSEASDPAFGGGIVRRAWHVPHGNGTPSGVRLGVGFHAQGDYWLSLDYSNGRGDFVWMAPRFRSPGNGGGSTRATFKAVAKLGTALDVAASTQQWLPFPYQPHPEAPWVSRHMDEGMGDLAMAINPRGTVVMALIEPEKKPLGHFSISTEPSLWVGFSPSLTPEPVYTALTEVYHGIVADNRDIPDLLGNHG